MNARAQPFAPSSFSAASAMPRSPRSSGWTAAAGASGTNARVLSSTSSVSSAIQAYGYLSGHDEVAVVDGDFVEGRCVAAYRTGDRVSRTLAVGMPPSAIRLWRQAVAAGEAWSQAVGVRSE